MGVYFYNIKLRKIIGLFLIKLRIIEILNNGYHKITIQRIYFVASLHLRYIIHDRTS